MFAHTVCCNFHWTISELISDKRQLMSDNLQREDLQIAFRGQKRKGEKRKGCSGNRWSNSFLHASLQTPRRRRKRSRISQLTHWRTQMENSEEFTLSDSKQQLLASVLQENRETVQLQIRTAFCCTANEPLLICYLQTVFWALNVDVVYHFLSSSCDQKFVNPSLIELTLLNKDLINSTYTIFYWTNGLSPVRSAGGRQFGCGPRKIFHGIEPSTSFCA